ncbi:MAG: hypothetical protein V4615_06970 [Bacteroidota bacterium]
MPDITDLLKNLEALDLERLASQTLKEHEHVIADLNATQLSQGLKSDGTKLTPGYAATTIQRKKRKGQVTDRVTLDDTHQHYQGLYAKVDGQDIEYGSKVEYGQYLENRYNKGNAQIYGLNEDSREDLVNGFVEGAFLSKLHEQTGL